MKCPWVVACLLVFSLVPSLLAQNSPLNPPANLTASTTEDAVTLAWTAPLPSRQFVEVTLGAEGGNVRSVDGSIEYVVPPGALSVPRRVRLTAIPIEEFHQEVVDRGITPIGEPLDRASLIEIEAPRVNLPTLLRIQRPPQIDPGDLIVFTQLLTDALRFLGLGSFSPDGSTISVEIPVNPQQGLPGAQDFAQGGAGKASFLREIQGNGIDDDGDGLVDEIEIFQYPDETGIFNENGVCPVTGAVTFSNGTPVPGARVSVQGPFGLPFVALADEFGRYNLMMGPFTGQTVSFTVHATAPGTGQTASLAADCVPGQPIVRNLVIDTNAPPGLLVDITSPLDEATLSTNVPTITGTVSDPSVSEVQLLVNGQYPSVTGVVQNGAFSVQVLLSFSTNSVIALARNQRGEAATDAVTLHLPGNVGDPPDLQVSLQWDKNNDVDLYLVTPQGSLIWFGRRTADGGSLNIDQLSGTASGPEVISFPPGATGPGRYGIAAQFFSDAGQGPSTATVSIVVRGRTLGTFQQVLTQSDPSTAGTAASLANVNPNSVWNVASVDMPAGALAPVRPLADFVLQNATTTKSPAAPPTADRLPALFRASPDEAGPAMRDALLNLPVHAPRGASGNGLAAHDPFSGSVLLRVAEVEPNNTTAQAQVLAGPSPLTLNGNAEVSDAGGLAINFTDGTSDDLEDLFKVTTTTTGLKLNLGGFASDCDLYLINESIDQVIASSNTIGATAAEMIDQPTLPAGTYFIGVSIFDAAPVGGATTPYTLTVTGALGGPPGPTELVGYRIYRALTPNARTNGSAVGEVVAGTTVFTDEALTSQRYYYQVTALYNTGESAPSNEADVTVSASATVWPGDTNNDLSVNQTDLDRLTACWRQAGPPRPGASTGWTGQPATPWTTAACTFADADGNGLVDQADLLPLGLNWNRSHSASPSLVAEKQRLPAHGKGTAPTLSLVIDGRAEPGQEFFVEVHAADVANLFGVSFELAYSPTTLLEPLAVEAQPWLGEDLLFLSFLEPEAGRISIGATRKAGQGSVTGLGTLARIRVRTAGGAAPGSMTNLTLENVAADDPTGALIPFQVVNRVVATGTEEQAEIPKAFTLDQNYPNPFNPSTTIRYGLPYAARVTLRVYNLLGAHLATLEQAAWHPAGYHVATWEARGPTGQPVPSGLYVYVLEAGRTRLSGRMVLLK